MDTLAKSCSPTIVITANAKVQTHEEATVYVKELDIILTMKVLEHTPAVLSLGKLCDENGYSYERINGQKPHFMKNVIRIPCNTENFVPIVVPSLSTSSPSSSHHSTSKTPSKQERPCSASSSSSSSSPTTSSSENETREREDRTESDTSPVPVSISNVDDRKGQPVVDQANQRLPKTNEKEIKIERATRCLLTQVTQVLTSRSGCKNSGKFWWIMKFLNAETHTPVLLMKYLQSPHPRDVKI